MRVFTNVTFEAAHSLPFLPKGHKCRKVHGHSYRVTIVVRGPVDEKMGWVVDYAVIKAAWDNIHKQIDHTNLNESMKTDHTTSERVAEWIYEHMNGSLQAPVHMDSVTVYETESSGSTYGGEAF